MRSTFTKIQRYWKTNKIYSPYHTAHRSLRKVFHIRNNSAQVPLSNLFILQITFPIDVKLCKTLLAFRCIFPTYSWPSFQSSIHTFLGLFLSLFSDVGYRCFVIRSVWNVCCKKLFSIHDFICNIHHIYFVSSLFISLSFLFK